MNFSWSFKKKWAATAIVSAFTFISPVSSSMIAPASDQLASDFGVTNNVVIALMTSIFVLAYGTYMWCYSWIEFAKSAVLDLLALGPLFLGPLSEIYGRSRVLQLANLWYLGEPFYTGKGAYTKWGLSVWNLGCGFSQNTGQLIAFRFLAGLGGSAPLTVSFPASLTIYLLNMNAIDRRGRRRWLLEGRRARASHCRVLFSSAPRTSYRTRMWCMDCTTVDLEMGGE